MQTRSASVVVATLLAGVGLAQAASGIPRFYGDAPDDHHPWAVHDPNRPQPPVVTPGTFSSADHPGRPPSDAQVLFDGTDLSQWESTKGGPARWLVQDGILQVTATGDIRTRAQFGDCQLHVEWAAPQVVKGDSQGRGNSGIFLMGRCEIQVLDSYHNLTYADGHAAALYGVNPPLVNALRPPGEFQIYDIVFRRPLYDGDRVVDPGHVTVFVNGVLVQDHTTLEGPTGHMVRARPQPFPAKGPLELQDHGNPVRYRNIWIRELPPRAVEGGTDGPLSTAATLAKRRQIAAGLRADAQQLADPAHPLPELLRLMESLEYEADPPTLQRVETLATAYVGSLQNVPTDQLPARRDEVRQVRDAFRFLTRFHLLPTTFGPKVTLDQFIRDHGLDRRR